MYIKAEGVGSRKSEQQYADLEASVYGQVLKMLDDLMKI